VAQAHRTQHTERVVEPDDLDAVIDRLRWHYDEPFNDYSSIPTYFVCREARRDVTVALSGDGGDETFAGYRKYRRLALRSAIAPLLPTRAHERVLAMAGAALPGDGRVATTLRTYGQDLAGIVTETLVTGIAPRALRDAARGPLRDALHDYSPGERIAELLANAPPAEVGLVNAMRYLDFKLTLGAGILTKVDRASMAVSLEVRPVYLHPTLLSLAGRIPPERLVDRSTTKKELKSALSPWLPSAVLYRPKAGFAMPLGRWLRDGRTRLLDRGGRRAVDEIIDPALGERAARAHGSHRRDEAGVLHSLDALDDWLTRWR